MSVKAYYDALIPFFLADNPERILGLLTVKHHHSLEEQQRGAWLRQISILKAALSTRATGRLFLEFYIPRMGKRADAVLVLENIVFVIEFKVGATDHGASAFNQVEDYALDLKNFHEGSHNIPIIPVLVSTHAPSEPTRDLKFAKDLVASPVGTNEAELGAFIDKTSAMETFPPFDTSEWMAKGYKPTPTIVEAAQVLYRTHGVTDISRSDSAHRTFGRPVQASAW